MTRKKFIKELEEEGYSYEIEGDKIIVTHNGGVWLGVLTTLPNGVKFENRGSVWLNALTTLPADVKFENRGYVILDALTTLPADVKFENGGDVNLNSLVGGWFGDWSGNIDGIASKRLLNFMISKGILER